MAAIIASGCGIYAFSQVNVLYDVALALLGSAAFVVMSSEISYRSLEQKNYYEYYWHLAELRHKAKLLIFAGEYASTWSDVQGFCDILDEIHAMLAGYFATCDREYRCVNREKIKCLSQTNDTLMEWLNQARSTVNEIRKSVQENRSQGANSSIDKKIDERTREQMRQAEYVIEKETLYDYLDKRVKDLDKYIHH